jgi:Raf kinase inhibitor-like YbhB/YbcL family protein
MAFEVKVAAWPAGGPIPRRYTCDGENVSPAVEWSGAPAATQSFVLILDDPDAPPGTWTHWILYDIPPHVHRIEEAAPHPPGLPGTNDFGHPAYGGPCPPRGHRPHRYFLRLFALSTATLGLPPAAPRPTLERALNPHLLARAACTATYHRP